MLWLLQYDVEKLNEAIMFLPAMIFEKIEWGNYVLILLIKMQQSTILKNTFSDCYAAYLWINIELLYCSDISFENFCQSVFFTLFPLGDVTVS